jgi:hypothetical protein
MLNFEILFSSMFNINILFYFVTVIFKNHVFKVGLSKLYQNTIFMNPFWDYLSPTFITLKFFKFYIQ